MQLNLFAKLAALAASAILLGALTGCSDKGSLEADKKDGGLTVNQGGIKASIGGATTVTEDDVRMPFYPGAKEKQGASMKVETDTEKSYMISLITSDEPQKVADFYTEKVEGMKFSHMKTEDEVFHASKKTEDGGKVAITIIRKVGSSETEISMGYGLQAKK